MAGSAFFISVRRLRERKTAVKNIVRLMLIGLLLLAVMPLAAQDEGPPPTGLRPDAPPYALRGPHPVGFMTFTDGNAERPITGAIWYPAIQPEGVEEAIVYDSGVGDIAPVLNNVKGRAILDAEPDIAAGPYPLVISSHGLGGPIYAIAYLNEQLASHGFVVMAPNHPGNTWRDNLMVDSDEAWAAYVEAVFDSMVMRPLDIRQTLDYAEALDGDMAGMIDMERVSVIGWSFGGYTALAAAGSHLDFSGVPDLCASGTRASMLTNMMCGFHADDIPGVEARLLEMMGIEAEPGQMWPSFADERVDAIVPLTPGGGTAVSSAEGFADVVVPMLMVRAGGDSLAVPEYNTNPAWNHIGSSVKAMVTLEDANHYLVGQCAEGLVEVPDWFPVCSDSVWDVDRAHDMINHFVTAFLLAQFYDNEEARAALAPDAVSFPGITYESEGF
jgi:predicted dienelactone hydrolase